MVRRSFVMSVLILTAAGGCARPGGAGSPVMSATGAGGGALAPVAALHPTNATVIGQSVQGRPIEMVAFGGAEDVGARPVFVIGAIHGNEPTSEDVARGLVGELRASPHLAGDVPVVVIPVANPDGLIARTRTNANKVDVNRNFPASNWSARPRGRNSGGGTTAASEPETVALITTIERLRPRLIISVHSMDQPCNNYDGPAKHVADVMSKHNGYPSVPTIGYPTPGSMGSWAGGDKRIPMVTLELPRKLPASRAWPDNRAAIFAAIAAAR